MIQYILNKDALCNFYHRVTYEKTSFIDEIMITDICDEFVKFDVGFGFDYANRDYSSIINICVFGIEPDIVKKDIIDGARVIFENNYHEIKFYYPYDYMYDHYEFGDVKKVQLSEDNINCLLKEKDYYFTNIDDDILKRIQRQIIIETKLNFLKQWRELYTKFILSRLK